MHPVSAANLTAVCTRDRISGTPFAISLTCSGTAPRNAPKPRRKPLGLFETAYKTWQTTLQSNSATPSIPQVNRAHHEDSGDHISPSASSLEVQISFGICNTWCTVLIPPLSYMTNEPPCSSWNSAQQTSAASRAQSPTPLSALSSTSLLIVSHWRECPIGFQPFAHHLTPGYRVRAIINPAVRIEFPAHGLQRRESTSRLVQHAGSVSATESCKAADGVGVT